MGCCCSTFPPNEQKNNDEQKRDDEEEEDNLSDNIPNGQSHVVSTRETDLLNNLKNTLEEDVEIFILNELLINIMFFYEYNENKTPAGNELKLLHDKQIILPDTVLNSFGHMIKNKKTKRPLTSTRMYINQNNSNIENGELGISDKLYRTEMEISQNKGFVRLQILNYKKIDHHSKFVKKSDDKRKIPYNKFNQPSTSTDKKNETEQIYAGLIAAKTPRPVDYDESDNDRGSTQLPLECFTLLSKDDKKKYYLNSFEFMNHFKTNVFPKFLGKDLGFPPDSFQKITSIDGSLFCESNLRVVYEIFPSIVITWPTSISDEWKERLKKKENWLTDIWTDDVNFECVLTAKGFVPKKGKNQCKDIEWEIEFPQAEQFLESKMPPLQKCMFAILMMLYHRFLENKSNKADLLINHIRHFMFWECENSMEEWKADDLGSKLKEVLEKLSNALGTPKLQHYFIPEINLFENLPRPHLYEILDKLQILKEEPLRHILDAFKNVTKSEEFDLNLVELWDMLYKIHKTYENTGNKNHANLKMKYMKEERKSGNYKHDLSEISLQRKFHDSTPLTAGMIKFFIEQFKKTDECSKKNSSGQNSIYLKHSECLDKILREKIPLV